jgi:hypothetical protein
MRRIVNGYRRRSATEWRGIIERYRQSGQGINEFCAQEGLTASSSPSTPATPSRWAKSCSRTIPAWLVSRSGRKQMLNLPTFPTTIRLFTCWVPPS